jgi:hypothetical protein
MAVQMINVGRLANDGTGDDLREAFIKINQNFQLFEFIDNPQGRNLGSDGAEVFAQVENGEFQFRRLIPGDNIQIDQSENTVQITGLLPRGRNLGSNGAEVFAQVEDGEFQFRRLIPGQNIQINEFENTVQITGLPSPSTFFGIVGDNSVTLNVEDNIVLRMQGDGNIITQTDNNTKTVSFGLTNTIANYLNFDFGDIDSIQNSIFEFVMNSIGVDMGTFTNPSSLSIDEGSIV